MRAQSFAGSALRSGWPAWWRLWRRRSGRRSAALGQAGYGFDPLGETQPQARLLQEHGALNLIGGEPRPPLAFGRAGAVEICIIHTPV
jgi:hypothetical protein